MGILFDCSHFLEVAALIFRKGGQSREKGRCSVEAPGFARIIYGDNDNTFEKILAKILA